ncbi:DUF6387 family protein [Pseudomonas sp. D47]|uniref:DUF6387 family protein n=1 Tax=Pseudomonas sp. D47 TaxID=3159447 RepID=UPI00387B6777
MAKAEIPDWFDLKFYQEPLSRVQWLIHIAYRVDYFTSKPLYQGLTEQQKISDFFFGIYPKQFDLPDNHIDPFPVKCMSASDLAVFSACWSKDPSWQALYQKLCSAVENVDSWTYLKDSLGVINEIYRNGSPLIKETARNPGCIEYSTQPYIHGAAVTINLNHDDEAIKQAFSVWLEGMRSEMSERVKKPFNDDDLQKWQKYQVLAAFDLCQWAEIKGFRYTNNQLANALFPPESIGLDERDVDMTERVRKLVKPLITQCVTHETVRSLESSVRLAMHRGEIEDVDIEISGSAKSTQTLLLDSIKTQL